MKIDSLVGEESTCHSVVDTMQRPVRQTDTINLQDIAHIVERHSLSDKIINGVCAMMTCA